MDEQAKPIVKGTTLYSMKQFDSQGFPAEIKVTKVRDGIIYTRQGTMPRQAIGHMWTPDWMTALKAWKGQP